MAVDEHGDLIKKFIQWNHHAQFKSVPVILSLIHLHLNINSAFLIAKSGSMGLSLNTGTLSHNQLLVIILCNL